MRIVNRLLAFVVAIALLGTSVILIVEVVAARSNSGPVIIHWHSILHWGLNTWKATSVELASAITAVAGLILLIPQLIRRKPSRLPIVTDDLTELSGPGVVHADTDAALTRKGVAVSIRNAVEDVDGITGSRVKVSKRHIRVRAVSSAGATGTAREMAPNVSEAAHERLDSLRLRAPLKVSVAVSSRRNRVS